MFRNTSAVNLFFRETTLEVSQQEFLYGPSNFIADVGGYLGLLLGVSIFSFYQEISSLIEKLFNKMKKTPQKNEFKQNFVPQRKLRSIPRYDNLQTIKYVQFCLLVQSIGHVMQISLYEYPIYSTATCRCFDQKYTPL